MLWLGCSNEHSNLGKKNYIIIFFWSTINKNEHPKMQLQRPIRVNIVTKINKLSNNKNS